MIKPMSCGASTGGLLIISVNASLPDASASTESETRALPEAWASKPDTIARSA